MFFFSRGCMRVFSSTFRGRNSSCLTHSFVCSNAIADQCSLHLCLSLVSATFFSSIRIKRRANSHPPWLLCTFTREGGRQTKTFRDGWHSKGREKIKSVTEASKQSRALFHDGLGQIRTSQQARGGRETKQHQCQKEKGHELLPCILAKVALHALPTLQSGIRVSPAYHCLG